MSKHKTRNKNSILNKMKYTRSGDEICSVYVTVKNKIKYQTFLQKMKPGD